jgi:hypothetical protein
MVDLTKLLSSIFSSVLQVSPHKIPYAYISGFASLALTIALVLPSAQERWFAASTPVYLMSAA